MAEAAFLICVVGQERFLFDIASVRQVLQSVEVTYFPGTPRFIEGLAFVDGQPVPVVDLRERLFPDEQRSPYPLVLIVSTGLGMLGIRVDDVRRPVTIDLDSLAPAPPLVAGLSGALFIAVVEIEGQAHLVADLEEVLTGGEKQQLRSLLSEAAPA